MDEGVASVDDGSAVDSEAEALSVAAGASLEDWPALTFVDSAAELDSVTLAASEAELADAEADAEAEAEAEAAAEVALAEALAELLLLAAPAALTVK